MDCPSDRAKVVAVERIAPAPADGVLIGGRLVPTGQDQLLEPFVNLLGAVEDLASLAGAGVPAGATEESVIRAAYRSLFHFFRTLLPSAGHEAIDGLTYSVSLLLVGEAIEAGRGVMAAPPSRAEVRGER
jgi:hypothetical protein